MSQNQLNRTFQVLNLVSDRKDGISYTDISHKCNDIAIATLARLLRSMIKEELLRKSETGVYFLGSAAISFANKAVIAISKNEIIQPHIDKLAELSNQSAAYFEWDGDCIKIACKKDWPGSMFYRQVGARNERVTTHPSSLVLLAYSDKKLIDYVIQYYNLNEEEIKKLRSLLDGIRKIGHFAGNDPGFNCSRVIYPVIAGDKLRGSVGVCILGQDLSENDLALYKFAVEKCAESISTTFTETIL